jgi:hypothetical protein
VNLIVPEVGVADDEGWGICGDADDWGTVSCGVAVLLRGASLESEHPLNKLASRIAAAS